MSDYCYCDRLLTGYEIRLQPKAFGLYLLQHNLPALLSHAEAWFVEEVSFRRCCLFPGGSGISFS